MHLKFQDRGGHFNTLLEKKTVDGDRVKNVTIKNFGQLSDSLTVNSEENKALLREVVKTVQKQKLEDFTGEALSPSKLAGLLNSLVQGECQSIDLGVDFINRVLDDFKLGRFFKGLQSQTDRGYDLYSYFTFLIAHEIIEPGSLLYYFNTKEEFSALLKDMPVKKQDLYDFLTFFYPHRFEFQRVFFETTVKMLGRQNVHIFFYDGTNYTCWNSVVDPDHFDAFDGEIKEGLRKFGHAKNKRFDKPCVSMGIIATELEIPLFYTIFPGNRQEIRFVKEDVRNLVNSLSHLNLSVREIITADAGLHSGSLEYWLAGPNNYQRREGAGYILGRSINKVDESTLNWALESKGYYPVSRGKKWRRTTQRRDRKVTRVKSRIITAEVDVKLKDGRKVKKTTRLKQVCVYSEKREFQALKVLDINLQKVKEFQNHPKRLKSYIKKRLSKYMDVLGIVNTTGELTDRLFTLLNGEAVEDEIQKAGLFIIETSETDWPDGKILHDYREKYHIEHLIKTLKSVIQASPAYVFKYEHIVSHYDMSALALSVLNYIKIKSSRYLGFEMSAERIQLALKQFRAISLNHVVIMIANISKDTQLLLKTFDIDLENKFETYFKIKKIFKVK